MIRGGAAWVGVGSTKELDWDKETSTAWRKGLCISTEISLLLSVVLALCSIRGVDIHSDEPIVIQMARLCIEGTLNLQMFRMAGAGQRKRFPKHANTPSNSMLICLVCLPSSPAMHQIQTQRKAEKLACLSSCAVTICKGSKRS